MVTYRMKLAISVSAKEDITERTRKSHKPASIESINKDFRESPKFRDFDSKLTFFI